MLDDFLRRELSFDRDSGTFLFYGEDVEKNFSLAKEFTIEIFCKEIFDEEVKKNIKEKVLKENYSDLTILDNIAIDSVREMIKDVFSSSHEGGRKVFILKNMQDIKKESANAMLKVIEEPSSGTFFILLSNKLSILPTIKSRSIIYRVKKDTPEELEVDKYEYDFFLGISKDILEYKKLKENERIDLYKIKEDDYKEISEVLKNYENSCDIMNKILLYKTLRSFLLSSSSLNIHEKIKFAEALYFNISSKETTILLVNYIINLTKMNKNLKNKLELKNMLRLPINMKLFFINLILEI